MLPQHSEVGGSGMGRWHKDACPGSVAAARHYPDLPSYAAEEGTGAHELAETCLKTGLSAGDYSGHVFNGITVNDEMIVGVQSYIDFIRYILKHYPSVSMRIEHKFHCPEFHPQMFSTIDTLLICAEERWAHVIDFKYGRVPVPVWGNHQLNYYSAPLLTDKYWLDIDHIGQTIHQPRLYRDNDFETQWTTPVELTNWVQQDLIPSMNLALTDDAPRVPGAHCRYCPAKLDCPELQQQKRYMVPPFPQTNEQIAWVLDMEKVFTNTVKDAKERAADNMMMGQTIPGYKPVKSYGKSFIADPSKCAGELLVVGLTHDEIYENKLKGITALKKNKLAAPIVQKYTVKGKTGITTAPMSSTKPAVAIPTNCFTKG